MSRVAELEAAGEVLSPAVCGALVAFASRAHAPEAESPTLKALAQRLEARVRELETRLASNSTNSSKPPSSDPPGTARPKKKRSGRRRGGQRGHKGAFRALLPPERVDEVVGHRPARCRRCGHSLETTSEDGHPLERRQLCWTHLKRNCQGVADGGPGAALGRMGAAECERLFAAWHRYVRGELSHAELARTLTPLRARLRRLLTRAEKSEDRRARAPLRDLLRLEPALWTSVRFEGVQPTSNAAERALREPVIARKTSLGSHSGKGLPFAERMLAIGETCRQRRIHLLGYIEQAIVAHRPGMPCPRLLPTG